MTFMSWPAPARRIYTLSATREGSLFLFISGRCQDYSQAACSTLTVPNEGMVPRTDRSGFVLGPVLAFFLPA